MWNAMTQEAGQKSHHSHLSVQFEFFPRITILPSIKIYTSLILERNVGERKWRADERNVWSAVTKFKFCKGWIDFKMI